jgi:hypothetical protein
MGTIVSRKRKDGSFGHTAQIRLKKDGKVIHTETETFDRKPAAQAWLNKREAELALPGALVKAADPPLKEVIDRYNTEKQKQHGKTKAQVLNTIEDADIGSMRCSEITSPVIVQFCQQIDAQPSTRGNYISHLASIFSVARPAWGYPLDKQAMDDARVVLDKLGLVGKSKQRTRRPTLAELDRLMTHFSLVEAKGRDRKKLIPMTG